MQPAYILGCKGQRRKGEDDGMLTVSTLKEVISTQAYFCSLWHSDNAYVIKEK